MKRRTAKQEKAWVKSVKRKTLRFLESLHKVKPENTGPGYVWDIDWCCNWPKVRAYACVLKKEKVFKLMREDALGSYWIRDGKWHSSADNDGVTPVVIAYRSLEEAVRTGIFDLYDKMGQYDYRKQGDVEWERWVLRSIALMQLYEKIIQRIEKERA